MLQLKIQRSGSKSLCGFSIVVILKGIMKVLKSTQQTHQCWINAETTLIVNVHNVVSTLIFDWKWKLSRRTLKERVYGFGWTKIKTLIKTQRNQKGKILHTKRRSRCPPPFLWLVLLYNLEILQVTSVVETCMFSEKLLLKHM